MKLLADNPIRHSEQDVLERKGSAMAFARDVLSLDASQGIVVGVFGAWGSGKTSFVNLASGHFRHEDIPVMEFNPWLFSGSDQLVSQFFSELSAELQLRDLDKVGKAWEEYGDALTGGQSNVSSIGVILKLIGRCLRRRQRGATGVRDRIRKILQNRTKPIIVVLDDIDRLSTAEIRAIFRLVRLTANFPNLIYILVCDRLYVEGALEEQGLQGRAYLKKIIQFPYDLPELPRQRFRGQVLATINDVLRSDQHSYPVGAEIAADVRDRIILPLVVNMRDLRQYAASLHGTLVSVDGRVSLDDLLALEATRLFMPDVFMRLPNALNALTFRATELEREVEVQKYVENGSEDIDQTVLSRLGGRCKEAVDGLVKLAGENREVVEVLVDRLFPTASGIRHLSNDEINKRVFDKYRNPNGHLEKQLKEGRVAHHEVLQFYLERVASGDLRAYQEAEQAFEKMIDRTSLERLMHGQDIDQQRSIVSYLRYFESQFETKHAVPGLIVLFNLLERIPGHLHDELSSIRSDVNDVSVLLLGTLKEKKELREAVRVVLKEVKSLSAKTDLVMLLGHDKEKGRKLLAETEVFQYEEDIREEMRHTSVDKLIAEFDLRQVLTFARRRRFVLRKASVKMEDDPRLMFAVLWAVGSQSGAQLSSVDWRFLEEIYGSKKELALRIKKMDKEFERVVSWIEARKIALEVAEHLRENATRYMRDKLDRSFPSR